MTRRFAPLNWVQWVTLLLLLAYAATTPLLFLQVRHVQAHQNDALRSIMCRGEHFAKTASPKIETPSQRQATIRFYEHALADAHLSPCSR